MLWGGAWRAPTASGILEAALIPFVFQGAANIHWSQDLLVRQEESQGDDLNVYIEMSDCWAQSRLRKGIWRWLAGEEDFLC